MLVLLFVAGGQLSAARVEESNLPEKNLISRCVTFGETDTMYKIDISEHSQRIRREFDSLIRAEERLSREITIACVGDMILCINYPDDAPRFAVNDGQNLFDDVKEYLTSADFTVGNLEGVFLDKGGDPKPVSDPKFAFYFRMPRRYVHRFIDAGFDFLSVANNHLRDFGIPGIRSTLKTLESAGLAHAGVKGECDFSVVERDSVRYGVCAFAPHMLMCPLDEAYAKKIIRTLREEHKCNIVIVSFHGGAEGSNAYRVPRTLEVCNDIPRGNVYKFAHSCIDAGADLVFGHGPHVVRGVELYNGKIIAYSLGNFCTPFGVKRDGRTGYAPILRVKMTVSGKFVGGEIISATQPGRTGPKRDSAKIVVKEIIKLNKMDFPESPLRISAEGKLYVEES